MPRYPRNYDDWNEAFWSLETLSKLRTTSGDSVMAASPAERWPLLERANWDEFLSTSCQKTHRELRWWTGLLASNRRIFLLHALTFGGCFVTVASSTPHWDFNGWHGLAMLPPVLSLPPLCGAGGLAFEAWAHRSLDSRKRFLYGSLLAALALLAALVAAVIMAAVPYWRFERSLAGCAEAPRRRQTRRRAGSRSCDQLQRLTRLGDGQDRVRVAPRESAPRGRLLPLRRRDGHGPR